MVDNVELSWRTSKPGLGCCCEKHQQSIDKAPQKGSVIFLSEPIYIGQCCVHLAVLTPSSLVYEPGEQAADTSHGHFCAHNISRGVHFIAALKTWTHA